MVCLMSPPFSRKQTGGEVFRVRGQSLGEGDLAWPLKRPGKGEGLGQVQEQSQGTENFAQS